MKILFVVKNKIDSYGISYGLVNSAKFVANALENFGVIAKVVNVIDGNSLDKEIHLFKPRVCCIEALFVTPSKLEELAKLHKNVQFIVRIHSKIPFLGFEGIAFSWLNQYKHIAQKYKNILLSSNNLETNDDLVQVLNFKFNFLPNIYSPKEYIHKKQHRCYSNYINISCLGAIRPLKNNLEQAVAAIIFAEKIGKKLNFHINSSRVEQRGDEILKNLRSLFESSNGHLLVEHPWTDHEKFIQLVKTIDIGMSVSMSESYCITLADHVANDIPVVGSNDISWLPDRYRAEPTNTQDIVNKLNTALITKKLTFLNKRALHRYNLKATKVWLEFLGQFKHKHHKD